MKAKLIEASYVEEAQSILMLFEKDGTQQRMQIHRKDIATFGGRTEEDIQKEMRQYASTMNEIYQGQEIELVKSEKE